MNILKRIFQTFFCVIVLAYFVILSYQIFTTKISSENNIRQEFYYRMKNDTIAEYKTTLNIPITQPLSETKNNRNMTTLAISTTTFHSETHNYNRKQRTRLEDVFISVKTTKRFHMKRVLAIVKTWYQLAKKQTWFFTDNEDPVFQELTRGHMVNTNCSSSHDRKDLCCKMSVEFDTFLQSGHKWFCHFDDDNYVNVPKLIEILDQYDSNDDWYLGKPSIRAPLEIHSRNRDNLQERISFWFATGGAGFCVSRGLAQKMIPFASGGKFINVGEQIRLPDDVTMGYIIEYLLQTPLTVINQFHSHLEPMKFLKKDTFNDQISFSYSVSRKEWNVLKIDGIDLESDPHRFLSLHCFLFPYFKFCPR